MNHVMGMTSRLSVGEAIFAFGYDEEDASALVGGRAETILTLLLPAFEHCFQTLDRRYRHRERLAKAISEASLPATILDADADVPPSSLLQLPLPELAPGSENPPYLSVSAPETSSLAARLAHTYELTERQRLTAELLLSGLSTTEIAEELGVRYNTARRHCEAVLQKTGAGQRHRLARMATAGDPST
ncbi:response regulator transcription factor [Amorphus sp. 3PC139-8]|uniref:helix-turn-helix transcriptional regulator n=1 Tax=Amorphus sp. 3PC139-8 TaxID=2735676 RepID=UPI00345CFE57